VGEPRDGKGVAVHLTSKLLGSAAHVSVQLSSLTSDGFKLEELIGKRLLIVPDMRSAGRVSLSPQTVELLLMISGGDDLTVDRKYKGAANVPPGIVPWLLANDVPKLPDHTGTIATRFEAIKHRISFLDREDHDLEDKLEKDLPGILKWAIEGYQRLLKQGRFTRPANAKMVVETLKRLASPITAFYHDRCSLAEGSIAWMPNIYDSYTAWFNDTHQEGEPENATAFGMHLSTLLSGKEGVSRDRSTRKGKREYFWAGLRVRK
jgi:putative DNA primase/helicase